MVSYLGFKTQEIVIKENQLTLNLKMKEDATMCLMGEVEVNEVYKSKRTLWQKIKGIF
ncbi:carboxypeptidase-like regulatory domain-containing protein [Aestuariivivens insulae]|uniref:carboxypeptidase-like regulatory domain-containing protein n=1 Tax=Aestuariivivens insulae TaxID=1621988 RepID=UPI001F58F945|nr:carboxypeptidase-like regulatory domain-containing protein [Aestuariivivens insulae]